MKRYWQCRKMHILSAEELSVIRREIFTDDLTGKIILPEDTIYYGDDVSTTIYRMGAITKPIELSELGEK